jgi:prepilin-type N-terminal cleavage/methylation domain-containing protein
MQSAFTLVELLVVIAIMVVLLALLTPALDQAIYEAELAVCGANLHGTGTGAAGYAVDHKRAYPHRPAIDAQVDYYPMQITFDTTFDLRPLIEPYINIRHMLLCPLVPEVDLTVEAAGTYLYSPYNLWFGWRFAGAPGMLRFGDRWAGYANDRRFTFLAGDRDRHGRAVYGTHPDRDDLMWAEVAQNEPIAGMAGGLVQTRWRTRDGITERGEIDMNMAIDDGSVTRYREMKWNDPRFVLVPDDARAMRAGWYNKVPAR